MGSQRIYGWWIRRRHLFEFLDLGWLPRAVRVELAAWVGRLATEVYPEAASQVLARLLGSGPADVVDLAAGSGVVRRALAPALDERGVRVRVTVTDLRPTDIVASRLLDLDRAVVFHDPRSIDVRDLPADLTGLRTMFSGFHHLLPHHAASMLRDCVDHGASVGVFEFTQRSALPIALSPVSAIMMALRNLVRPAGPRRLRSRVLTPLTAALYCWDATVSHLRTYTVDELLGFASAADPDERFRWEAGIAVAGSVPVTYLAGRRPSPNVAAEH